MSKTASIQINSAQLYIFEDEGKLKVGKYRRFTEMDIDFVSTGADGQIDKSATGETYGSAVNHFIDKADKEGWPQIYHRDLIGSPSVVMLPARNEYFLVSGGWISYYRRFEDLASAKAALSDAIANGWPV